MWLSLWRGYDYSHIKFNEKSMPELEQEHPHGLI